MKIKISNGRLIDPANDIDKKGTLCIAGDVIVFTGSRSPSDFTPDIEIDAAGQWVCPGIIDLGARFREPGLEHKATIASESAAAASGGVTAVCYPPDTDPVLDTPAVVELIHQRTEKCNKTRIYPIAALTHALGGEFLAEIHALKEAGCLAVSNANRPIASTEVWRRAMEYSASVDIPIFIHPEDPFLRNSGVVHEGALSTRLGLPPIPNTAETLAVSQALLLIEQTGVRAHFCRLSCSRSIELIAQAKREGLPVTADVSVCHLFLTEMDVDGYNTDCHLIPPLRGLTDKQALTQGLVDGIIDAVCSDHQPHDDDAKAAPFSLTEPGASSLELLLPLMLDLTHKKILSPTQVINCLSANPARILGLESGSLSKGSPADIILIDTNKSWTVNRENLLSAGKNTPFDGWELQGKVSHTLLAGEIVFQQGN